MLALRFAAVLALVVWIGGLVTLGALAAPAAFEVLGARGAEGRTLAGTVVGETLRRFNLVTYACAAVVLLSLTVRGVLGPRPRRFALRIGGLALMTAAARMVNLVAAVVAEGDPDPRMFEALEQGLRSLVVSRDPGLNVLLFQIRVLGVTGFKPQTQHCASCGRNPPEAAPQFSPSAGGLVCHVCARRQAMECVPLSRGSVAFLQQALQLTSTLVSRLNAG